MFGFFDVTLKFVSRNLGEKFCTLVPAQRLEVLREKSDFTKFLIPSQDLKTIHCNDRLEEVVEKASLKRVVDVSFDFLLQ